MVILMEFGQYLLLGSGDIPPIIMVQSKMGVSPIGSFSFQNSSLFSTLGSETLNGQGW